MQKTFRIILITLILTINSTILISSEYSSYIVRVSDKISFTAEMKKLSESGIKFRQIYKDIDSYSKQNSQLSGEQLKAYDNLTCYYVVTNSGEDPDAALQMLQASENIISIEPNYKYEVDEVTTNDPKISEQWGLNNVNAGEAWNKSTGKNILVGVVDTGIEFDHEDLKNNLWINEKEDINNNGTFEPWPSDEIIDGLSGDINNIDDDGNGYADDVIGYDFVDQELANLGDYSGRDPIPSDEHGHGTSVSGVIAAENNNGLGISGLAYDAKIVTLRAFDITGNAETDDIASAIVYGALNGVKVMNFSFGEDVASKIMHDAIKFAYSKGCVMVSSSGNSGWSYAHYPSDFDEVISVGYSNAKNSREYRSNYGVNLTLLAPGAGIMTCDLFNTYKSASGSSLAAPFVSAVSAMLAELYPDYGPEDIKGIIQASAMDIGDRGWDEKTGSGILDAANAVNMKGSTNLCITNPGNDALINSKKTNEIAVTGSVATPLFDSYQLLIAFGSSPSDNTWDTLTALSYEQILDDTLALINLGNYYDTTYTLKILVNLKNQSTLEKRISFEVSTGKYAFEFMDFITGPVYKDGTRQFVVSGATSYKSRFSVKFRPMGSVDPYIEVSEYDYYDYFHDILIGREAREGVEYEAIAQAIRADGDTLQRAFTFTGAYNDLPVDKFTPKNYSMSLSYLHNQVADLFGDGKPAFAVNDISNGNWESTKIYQYIDGQIVMKDSISDIWIPVGYGDSNGDGIQEVFTKSGGKSVLFQASKSGESPLSGRLLEKIYSNNFWAVGMYDIDGDGKEELIANSDTALHILSYKNGTYEQIAMTYFPGGEDEDIGTLPGVAAGDFDADGNIEICHSNHEGHLYIFEYTENGLEFENAGLNEVSASSQYMCSADIDGDGTPEILNGNYGGIKLYGYNEVGFPIWTFRVIKSTGADKYDWDYWEEQIHGVRSGSSKFISYRNGLAAGNLDNEAGDEIVLSAFPNLYVLKWNEDKMDMDVLWWYPSSYSNSAIIYDFDQNGINELGFTTWGATRFFEYNTEYTGPRAPAGIYGFATDNESAYVYWEATEGAEKYELIRLYEDYSGYSVLFANTNEAFLDGLDNNTEYIFAVRAINGPDTSELSSLLNIYTHDAISAVNIYNNEAMELAVGFSGRLKNMPYERSLFELSNGDGDIILPVNILNANDSLLILSYKNGLPPGDYIMAVKSLTDYYGSPTLESELNINIPEQTDEESKLYLKSLAVLSATQLELTYSDAVTRSSAENTGNYSFSPFGAALSISQTENPEKVIINLDPSYNVGAHGIVYSLTVNNVLSEDDIQITEGAGNTLSFVFAKNDLNDVFVYPNPVNYNSSADIYFANLTVNAEVEILTLQGESLRTLTENDGNGGVIWDGLDDHGNKLKSGVYLYRVNGYNANGERMESSLKKFMVIH